MQTGSIPNCRQLKQKQILIKYLKIIEQQNSISLAAFLLKITHYLYVYI